MSYLALYRKWRPLSFDDVRGQDAIVRALRNQIIYNRIAHAYLFSGTRGTGKTSVAKLFARAVNCLNPEDGNPCGQCSSCKAILDQSSLDVIEIDAASNNSVDNIRDIRDQIQYMPLDGRYKVYIIDEVHMLSPGAFNALLKTLEEPPSYVIFILATTEKQRIPVTILSRCQKYDFHRIAASVITDHMTCLMKEEGLQAEDRALEYIARAAEGSMRDALSLLDQCISFYMNQPLSYDMVLNVLGASDTTVFHDMTRALAGGNALAALQIIDDVFLSGRELSQFLADYLWFLRNLLLLKDQNGEAGLVDLSAETITRLKEEASRIPTETLLYWIRSLSGLSGQLRLSLQKRILLETGFIRLCRPEMESGSDSLLARLDRLEQTLEKDLPQYRQLAQSGSLPVNGAGMITGPYTGPAESADGPSDQSSGRPLPENNKPKVKSEDDLLAERFTPAEAGDLRQIAGNWEDIILSAGNLMQMQLRQAKVTVADDSSLLQLLFDADNILSENAKTYFEKNNHENLNLLSDLVAEKTGKRAEFTCILSAPKNDGTPYYIDLSKIHTTITYEDD